MNPLEQVFESKRDGVAFMPFVTAGLPSPEAFGDVLAVLDKGGADIIEVGLPFSDPIADGPTIQAASIASLSLGTSTQQTLQLIGKERGRVKCPIVLMTYFNPILRVGLEEFAGLAARAGVSGVIIPDLPPEEAGLWKEAAGQAGLATIFLITPVTPDERIELIASYSEGFVYYVNLTGVTGSGIDDPGTVGKRIARVKELAKKPVAAGFGISTPELAANLARYADGVIVGSHFVKLIMDAAPGEEIEHLRREVHAFTKALANMEN